MTTLIIITALSLFGFLIWWTIMRWRKIMKQKQPDLFEKRVFWSLLILTALLGLVTTIVYFI